MINLLLSVLFSVATIVSPNWTTNINAAEEIAKKAYWNSSYFGGTFADLKHAQLW